MNKLDEILDKLVGNLAEVKPMWAKRAKSEAKQAILDLLEGCVPEEKKIEIVKLGDVEHYANLIDRENVGWNAATTQFKKNIGKLN